MEEEGRPRAFREEAEKGHGGQGLRSAVRRPDLPSDPGFRRLRVSGVSRRELRAAGVLLGLDQAPPPRRFPRVLAEQPADGLLPTFAAGAGREEARRGGTFRGRNLQPMGLHAGGRRGRRREKQRKRRREKQRKRRREKQRKRRREKQRGAPRAAHGARIWTGCGQ